jgi:hypothetical protein
VTGGRWRSVIDAVDQTKVLFMSGYTDDDILRRGVSGAGAPFCRKPFTPDELAASSAR